MKLNNNITLDENHPPLDYKKEVTFFNIIDLLLKAPSRLINEKNNDVIKKTTIYLLLISIICLAVFGFINGLFSGGMQIIYASVKYPSIILLSSLICLPSLYIFIVLTGVDISIQGSFYLLLTSLSLCSLILIGFSPVLWVFTQSTLSSGFIGFLNIIFWLLSVFIGFRIMFTTIQRDLTTDSHYLKIWIIIFLLVVFQMTTTLRPLIGHSDKIITTEKKFFYFHWIECLDSYKE